MYFKFPRLGAYLVMLAIWLDAAAAGLLKASVESRLPHTIDVERGSFMLVAQVSVKQHDNTLAYYDLEEFHSSWQVRSRLNYKEMHNGHYEGPAGNDLLGWRGTIYATASEAFVLRTRRRRRRNGVGEIDCARAEHDQVNEALKLDFLAAQNLGMAIGLARLLLLIERHSGKFERAPANSKDTSSFYQANLDNGLTLTLVYDKAGLPLGVPQQVLVESGPKFKMLVKFLRVAPLTAPLGELILSDSGVPSVRQAHTTGAGDAGHQLLFDLFAIERAQGCLIDQRVVRTSGAGDFLQALAKKTGRFSFEARLRADKLVKPLSVRVGYEPTLNSLRVERLMASRETSTLVNYNSNLIYHEIRRRTGSDTVLDKILKVDQNDRLDNDRSCVVLQAAPPQIESARVHTLGEMLLGIEADTPTGSKITYLGLARVRGTEAHAYEAHGTQLPAWLEQHSVYQVGAQKEAQWASRWRARTATSKSSNLTSVFYLSRSIDSDRLLLIEVFTRHPGDNGSGSRLTMSIPIYDFTWQLRTTAPGGKRMEDFYSLGDECLAGARGENYHTRINLELKRGGLQVASETDHWLRLPVRRNLAILRAMHEQFVVPSTTVYDLESKYDESNSSIAVTMLTAEHLNQPIQLVYLGKALLRRLAATRFHPFWTLNFQVCYLVASHKQEDTLFAFNPVDSNCYTLRTQFVQDEPLDSYFYWGRDFPLETYKIVHPHDDRTAPTNLDSLDKRLQRFAQVILRDPGLEIAHLGAHQVPVVVHYTITRSEVKNNLDSSRGVIPPETSDQHLFRGLGLVAGSSPTNELVYPMWAAKTNPPGEPYPVVCQPMEMSFVQCQGACLLSLQCRAFSTCIVQGQLECVLTIGNFRAPDTLANLARLQAAKRVKLGQVFQVNASVSYGSEQQQPVTEAIVHLKRHPTCELHRKQYSRLFSGEHSGPTLVNLRDYRLLTPVARPAWCAKLCFRTTLEAVRQQAAANNSTIDPNPAHLCSGYFYLDNQEIARANLTISPEQVRVVEPAQSFSTGYCLLDSDSLVARQVDNKPAQLVVLQGHRFEFDYRIFYESNYGRYLVESDKTPTERDAYEKIMSGSDGEQSAGGGGGETAAVMKAFVERGGNTGRWVHASGAAECARLCFTQAALVWPACRSFGFIEVGSSNETGANSFCAFNSVTMRELLALGRADMIWHEGQPSPLKMGAGVHLEDQFHVWHFEPSRSLLANQEHKPNLMEAFKATRHPTPGSGGHIFKTIGLFVTIYLLAMVGFVAGLRLGTSRLTLNELLSRLRIVRGFRGDRDRDRLVAEHPSAGTEFDDIARAEPPSQAE